MTRDDTFFAMNALLLRIMEIDVFTKDEIMDEYELTEYGFSVALRNCRATLKIKNPTAEIVYDRNHERYVVVN